ncbi:uncharacterized protein LOC110979734 [Acanthaster planci]|uniref:Uncharacterized protein LOC110979734 n=1 Tax=Acanthaster planci TaxID=133434 RepID=A0A8B7YDZ4_ACAPL|nr:uncharacterized protein LOC110979734 [Acanthaster planci]
MEEQRFIVRDTLPLFYNEKINSIELCMGDLSELGMRNKVDILLISALPDGYDTPVGTVMHSLRKNLNVSVADLAQNKEADKRATHKCWWSKPLGRTDVPFDRIMCYESGQSQAAATEFTNTTFSCLKDIYKKQDFRLVVSLLNTGQQKMDEVLMLEAIVEAAIIAMQDGLNLRQLMLFINAEYKSEADYTPKVRNFEGICAKFEELRARHTA